MEWHKWWGKQTAKIIFFLYSDDLSIFFQEQELLYHIITECKDQIKGLKEFAKAWFKRNCSNLLPLYWAEQLIHKFRKEAWSRSIQGLLKNLLCSLCKYIFQRHKWLMLNAWCCTCTKLHSWEEKCLLCFCCKNVLSKNSAGWFSGKKISTLQK